MKDELISFGTAKLAKKKKFNEWCDTYFDVDKFSRIGSDFDVDKFSRIGSDYGNSFPDILYYQPSQSLLQRWLREVHNIHVEVTSNFVTIDAFKKHRKWYVYVQDEEIEALFDSYEQALETGLFKALKLIK
jgi:hypothetical protein